MSAVPCPCAEAVPPWLCRVFQETGWSYEVEVGTEDGSSGYARLPHCPCCEEADRWETRLHLASGRMTCGNPGCHSHLGLPASRWLPFAAPDAVAQLEYTWGADHYEPTLSLDESRWALPAMLEDALAWTNAKPGRGGIFLVRPPGAGKTKAIIDKLARTGRGTLLAPRHDLRSEMVRRFREAGGRECVEFKGVLRQMREARPDLVARLETFQDLGYNPLDFLPRDDRPKAVSGEGLVGFGAHDHARIVPVKDVAEDGETEDHRPCLRPPVLFDEKPPLLITWKIEAANIELLTSRSTDPDLDSWLRGREVLATIIVEAMSILRARRRTLPAGEKAYAEYVTGADLEAVLVEAAGGEEHLQTAIRRTPSLAPLPIEDLDCIPRCAPEVCTQLPPLPEVIFDADPIEGYFPHHYAPEPPRKQVRSGAITSRDWPHRYTDHFIAALLAEAESTGLGRPPGFTACLVVTGRGDGAKVHGELRRPWSLGLFSRASFVIADATAGYDEAALRAAWPEYELRFFRARVLDGDSQATTRIWVRCGKSSFSRRALLTRDEAHSIGGVKHQAIPSLVRLLTLTADIACQQLGQGKKLAFICPKPVASLLQASMPDDETGGDGRHPRLRAVLRDLVASKRLGGLLTAHQGATSGTNALEECDALLTLPFVPNLGAVRENARALGVDGDEHLLGLVHEELVQSTHRLRSLRATQSQPKLLVHVGHDSPPDWDLFVDSVDLPEGGPVPSTAASAATLLTGRLVQRHGAVSASLIRLIAEHPDWYQRATKLPDTQIEVETAWARDASSLSRSALERVVRKATPDAWKTTERHPSGRGGKWGMREIWSKAAKALVRALREASDAA